MRVSPHLLKFSMYFVRPGRQLCRAFDPSPLSYLEHCNGLLFQTWVDTSMHSDDFLSSKASKFRSGVFCS